VTPEQFRTRTHGRDPAAEPGDASASPPGALWSLRVEDATGALTWHELTLDAYDVGREAGRAIRLASREVSRLHARLERDGGGDWWLVPEAERADTLVNGKPARGRRRLAPWDDVLVGDFHLRLVPREGAGRTPERLRELLTPFLDGEDEAGRAPPARVRIYEGPLGGHDVRLDKGVVVFGSGPDVTVPLEGSGAEGVYVEFRAVKGGIEVVDRSQRQSMTINGHELRRCELVSDELVGIGDVERQRKDSRDALEVRFLPSERRPDLDTTPAPRHARPPRPATGGAGRAQDVPSSPPPDATDRVLGATGAVPLPRDTALTVSRDTAVDLVSPHGPPAEGRGPTPPPPSWPDGGAPGASEPPTSRTLHDVVAVSAPPSSGSAPSTVPAPPPSSRPPSSGRSREPSTEPCPPPTPPTVPPPSASRADAQSLGRMDASADGGSTSLHRAGVALASLVVAVVLLWLWWKPSPTPGIAGPTPRPTASDVATSVPGPASVTYPTAHTPPSAPEPPPVPPPRRAPAPSADALPRQVPPVRPRAPAPVSASGATEPNEPAEINAQDALRRRLEAKARTGKATTGELQTLLTLCHGQRDAACVALAKAQLAPKEAP